MSCRPIHAGHLHKALCVSELQRTERNVHATLDQSTTQDESTTRDCGINGKCKLVKSLGRQTVFLYYTQLSRVLNDLSTSGDQNLHFDAKFDIACASLSRNSHKR